MVWTPHPYGYSRLAPYFPFKILDCGTHPNPTPPPPNPTPSPLPHPNQSMLNDLSWEGFVYLTKNSAWLGYNLHTNILKRKWLPKIILITYCLRFRRHFFRVLVGYVPDDNITLLLESREVSTHNSTNQECHLLLKAFLNSSVWENVNQLHLLKWLSWAFGVKRGLLYSV